MPEGANPFPVCRCWSAHLMLVCLVWFVLETCFAAEAADSVCLDLRAGST